MSLRRLGVDRIDLFQLHRIDDKFPAEDQIGELVALQQEGKIRHIGLSEVTVEQLEAARKIAPIVSVQNMYNLTARRSEPLLETCEAQGIGFIPWAPLGSGPLVAEGGPLQKIAAEHGVGPSQLAVAWLLKRSPVMLPIPGTSKVTHLEENVAAAEIELSDEEFETLSNAACLWSETTCALLADDAQVVGGFELGDPVVEEFDAVRFAQAIQFVESDGALAQPVSEVLEEELESTRRVHLDEACRLWPRVPHGVGDPARLHHPASGRCPDDLVADPRMHLSRDDVEPDIVLMNMWW